IFTLKTAKNPLTSRTFPRLIVRMQEHDSSLRACATTGGCHEGKIGQLSSQSSKRRGDTTRIGGSIHTCERAAIGSATAVRVARQRGSGGPRSDAGQPGSSDGDGAARDDRTR